jgi:hypothetical protein
VAAPELESRPSSAAGRGPWRGENLEGRTLWSVEQGLECAIHFARYLPRLRCGRLLVRAPRTLHRLLETLPCSLELIAPGAYLPAVDFSVSIMSLAFALNTTLESIPGQIAYLGPEPAETQRISERLGPKIQSRIGLCWRGNPDHVNDSRRSIPPERLEGLVRGKPAEWVNLQIPPTPEDLEFLPFPGFDALGLEDFGTRWRCWPTSTW